MQFRLDDNRSDVSLNGTNFADGPTRLWSVDYLEDSDHQLFVNVKSLKQNGTVAVDYFEYGVPLLHFITRIVPQQSCCFQG